MNNADAWAPIPEVLAQQAWCDAQDSAFQISILRCLVASVLPVSHTLETFRVPALPLKYTRLDL